MDNTQTSRKTLLIVFIGGALIFLLLLVVIFLFLRSSQKNQQPVTPTPTTMNNEPTLVKISPTIKVIKPTSQPIIQLQNAATHFTLVPPTDVTASFIDHSASDLSSTMISIQNSQQSFFVSIVDNSQKVPSQDLALNPGKQSPHIVAYSPQDFETIAIVDGKELLVSRTGAADVMVVNNKERIYAMPEMVAKNDTSLGTRTEYYVYQKYGTGISEYLSIFQNPNGTYPSYSNYTMVSYHISIRQENSNWGTNKKLLTSLLLALKKK